MRQPIRIWWAGDHEGQIRTYYFVYRRLFGRRFEVFASDEKSKGQSLLPCPAGTTLKSIADCLNLVKGIECYNCEMAARTWLESKPAINSIGPKTAINVVDATMTPAIKGVILIFQVSLDWERGDIVETQFSDPESGDKLETQRIWPLEVLRSRRDFSELTAAWVLEEQFALWRQLDSIMRERGGSPVDLTRDLELSMEAASKSYCLLLAIPLVTYEDEIDFRAWMKTLENEGGRKVDEVAALLHANVRSLVERRKYLLLENLEKAPPHVMISIGPMAADYDKDIRRILGILIGLRWDCDFASIEWIRRLALQAWEFVTPPDRGPSEVEGMKQSNPMFQAYAIAFWWAFRGMIPCDVEDDARLIQAARQTRMTALWKVWIERMATAQKRFLESTEGSRQSFV